MTDEAPSPSCAECGQADPGQVIVTVKAKPDSRMGFLPARTEAAGITPYGVVVPRHIPERWGVVGYEAWVSYLADGSTARYSAGIHPDWRRGESICRDCRDKRVPPAVHGRGT